MCKKSIFYYQRMNNDATTLILLPLPTKIDISYNVLEDSAMTLPDILNFQTVNPHQSFLSEFFKVIQSYGKSQHSKSITFVKAQSLKVPLFSFYKQLLVGLCSFNVQSICSWTQFYQIHNPYLHWKDYFTSQGE